MDERDELTATLTAYSAGTDPGAAERLFPQVYDRLRALAAAYMKGERASHTLQPTALVHEAYMRMVDIERVDWQGKSHFYAVAARQMRRILVDHARTVSAKKRGEAAAKLTLDEGMAVDAADPTRLLALDEALKQLSERHERQAQVAELRLFAGMQVVEIAHYLDVSERTVKGDWRVARAWLADRLG